MMVKPLSVGLADYAEEIRGDLPSLIAQHPKGIRIHVLTEEYGETTLRTLRALQILEDHGILKVVDALPPYVIPTNYVPPDSRPYQDLSDLQRRLLIILAETATPPNIVRTSYAQISRLLDCSTGGARSAIERLASQRYITITQQPQQGISNGILLSVDKDKIAVAQKKPT